jgi:A/G-specific adenine glycosylase
VPAIVLDQATTVELQHAILAWYRAAGRELEFRTTRDPYAILVSEFMAQQTQIGRVVEHWRRFIDRFPSFADLAAASPADVIRQWRGLGYNRRALNLHRCARRVVSEFDGTLPADVPALETLPGIGPYTARAVVALAFGQPVGAVDVNVSRVLGRIWSRPAGAAPPRQEIQGLAEAIVPLDNPGEWTHAVMDVGATFCRRQEPRCEDCPARPWCRFASQAGGRRTAGERRARAPFPTTTRWLRGRILDHLRLTAGNDWVEVPMQIGSHGADSVSSSILSLARDGLLELRDDDPRIARLPA